MRTITMIACIYGDHLPLWDGFLVEGFAVAVPVRFRAEQAVHYDEGGGGFARDVGAGGFVSRVGYVDGGVGFWLGGSGGGWDAGFDGAG